MRKIDIFERKPLYERTRWNNWYVLQLLSIRTCVARCSCGYIGKTSLDNIIKGKSRACDRCRTKGQWYERRAYTLLKYRCETPTSPDWNNYGGRGIKNKFSNFEEFIAEMGEAPSRKHTVDRINIDQDYEPGNVRWATSKEQGNNRRNNVYVTFKGRTLTASQWQEITGIKAYNITRRLASGWTVKDALYTSDKKTASLAKD